MSQMFPLAVTTDGTYWTVGLSTSLVPIVTHIAADGTQVAQYNLGGAASDMPSIEASGTHVCVTIRGGDNGLYTNVWSGSAWSGWNSLGGAYVHPVITG